MAAPFPPQGNQTPHTERPLKIYAEQYLAAAPLPVGTSVEIVPPGYEDGRPRVYLPGGPKDLHETDWVISNRYTGVPVEVISAEEFAERFGPASE